MKYQCEDAIAVIEDVYPEGFCQHLIHEFERNSNEWGITRRKGENIDKHKKEDFHIFLDGNNIVFHKFEEHNAYDMYWDGLQKCFDMYCEDFSILKTQNLTCKSMKMQKTEKGGGYHLWHSEQANGPSIQNRGVTYMLYLNSLPNESCGETEFLYQQKRIQPKQNTMVLWPAAYTHMHRGNAVYGDIAKYVSTGWFLYD